MRPPTATDIGTTTSPHFRGGYPKESTDTQYGQQPDRSAKRFVWIWLMSIHFRLQVLWED